MQDYKISKSNFLTIEFSVYSQTISVKRLIIALRSLYLQYYFAYTSYSLDEAPVSAKLGLCHIFKDGNFLHPLAVILLVSLVRVKSTVKYIICVITVSTVMFKLS